MAEITRSIPNTGWLTDRFQASWLGSGPRAVDLGTELSATGGRIYLRLLQLPRSNRVIRIQTSTTSTSNFNLAGPDFSSQMESSGSITFTASNGSSVTVTGISDATEPYEWEPSNLADVRAFANTLAGLTDRSLTVVLNDNAGPPNAQAPGVTINEVAAGREGTTVQLGATPTGGAYDDLDYLWSVSGGTLDNAASATPTWTRPTVNADTDYTISLRLTAKGTGTNAVNNSEDVVTVSRNATVTDTPLMLSDFSTPDGVTMDMLALYETGALSGNAVVDATDSRGSITGDSTIEYPDSTDSRARRFQVTTGGALIVIYNRGGSGNFSTHFGATGAYANATTYLQIGSTVISLTRADIESVGQNFLRYNIPAANRALVNTLRGGAGRRFILGVGRATPSRRGSARAISMSVSLPRPTGKVAARRGSARPINLVVSLPRPSGRVDVRIGVARPVSMDVSLPRPTGRAIPVVVRHGSAQPVNVAVSFPAPIGSAQPAPEPFMPSPFVPFAQGTIDLSALAIRIEQELDYLASTAQPSSIPRDTYTSLLETLNANYAALRASVGDEWSPGSGDAIAHANEYYAFKKFLLLLQFAGRWRAGFPLWAVADDLQLQAQRRQVELTGDETDGQLRRRIFLADEDEVPLGSLPYVRQVMRDVSSLIVSTGIVVQSDFQTFNCYVLTSEVDDGQPSLAIRNALDEALLSPPGKRQSHTYTLQTPTRQDYAVSARVFYDPARPYARSSELMLNAARASIESMMRERRKLGYAIRLDDIRTALKVEGVEYSMITSPAGDLVPADESTYYYGTGHTITIDEVM